MSLDTQKQFAIAVRDARQAVPDGLAAWNGPRPERRFGVYRNNVAIALTGALTSRFPACEQIVGDAFLAAMAREFVRLHPPLSPLLLAYGDDFPAFVAQFEPARDLPYLPDVLRLEVARGKAYHAEDMPALDAGELAAVSPERLGDLIFQPHPSLTVLRSAHPIVTIWAMNAGEADLAPIEDWRGEDALIVRPEMIVNVHLMPPGGATFVLALAEGRTLAAAVAAASEDTADFDLTANLAGILQAGAFTASSIR